jgi:hypothetical protein
LIRVNETIEALTLNQSLIRNGGNFQGTSKNTLSYSPDRTNAFAKFGKVTGSIYSKTLSLLLPLPGTESFACEGRIYPKIGASVPAPDFGEVKKQRLHQCSFNSSTVLSVWSVNCRRYL